MSERVIVGDMQVFKAALADAGVVDAPRGCKSIFASVPVALDARVPPGVWAMVPHGKTITDEGVQVGAMSPEYADAARGFAMVLRLSRAPQGETP